jgi:hypothetical protein
VKPPDDGWDRDERDALEQMRDELDALRVRHPNAPPLDLLRAARQDALPSDLQAAAGQRLKADAWSRALVEGLDDADVTLSGADQDRLLARIKKDAGRAPERAASRGWLQPALAAAALVAVVAGAWAIRSGLQQPPPASAPQAEQTVAVKTPEPPRFELPFDKPDVTLSMAALTWRGGGSENQLLVDLKPGLDAFRQGDYAKAEREFAALEGRYPKSVEVFFYGAIARLFLNQPPQAAASLQRAGDLADETFAPRIAWYRAIAEQRAGHTADARARLDSICRGSGAYSAQACDARDKLDAATKSPNAR